MENHHDLRSIPAFLMYRKQSQEITKKKRKKSPIAGKAPHPEKKQKSIKVNGKPKKSFVGNDVKVKRKNRKKSISNETVLKLTNTSREEQPTPNPEPILQHNLTSDNPELDALSLFKWLIDPVSPETFFKTYWEKKTLHIKRQSKNYYTHVFNSTVLDKILRNNNLHYTRNVDVVCYENGVKEVYNQEGRATSSALWDYYGNGCSIRILNPHTYTSKVHLLLATLQEYFGSMVGANVYLTPPGSQGFAPHYDDIEAFVIQLEGRKHWKLYQPKNSDVLARFSSPNLNREDIGEPFMELTLNAGEVLYFPRGTIHEGRTDDKAHSLHITVSVYQQTCFADLLQHVLPEALKKASEEDVEFRKGLPLNYLKCFGVGAKSQMEKLRKPMQETVVGLIQSLVKYMDVDLGADLLGRKFMHDSMPPLLSKQEVQRTSKGDGPCLEKGKVINKVNIELTTRIRLLRYYCIRLVQERDAAPKLYYNTENATVYHGEEEQWLELDPSMVPSVKLLQNTYPSYLEVEELPMEDEASKMQLISDLWEHGLIVTEEPLENDDDE